MNALESQIIELKLRIFDRSYDLFNIIIAF